MNLPVGCFDEPWIPGLEGIIQGILSDARRPVSGLGFFSKPVRLSGSNGHLVAKIYRPVKQRKFLQLYQLHNDYVAALQNSPLLIPSTRLQPIISGSSWRPVILQQAFEPEEMLRDILKDAEPGRAVYLMEAALLETLDFWDWRRTAGIDRLGLHPTLRNFALRDGQLHYFDTFPPMIGLSEKELQGLILDFAPYSLNQLLKPLALPFMSQVTDEYYQEAPMLSGIVGSCCRLRPELAEDFLDRARRVTTGRLSRADDQDLQGRLSKAPKLSPLWVSIRRILGKEGRPNI